MAEAYKLYGIIYLHMQKWGFARESFQQGLELCEECDNQLTKAEICYELGALSNKEEERKEALSHMREAVDIYETLGVEKEAQKIKNEMQAIVV
jgi:tetratricopeptide (TPR) repeat protein